MFRFGGVFGSVFALVVGIRYFGSVGIGIGQRSPLGDVLFCGIAGVLLGTLSAETFRLGRSSSEVAAASLATRLNYRSPRVRQVSFSLCGITFVVGIIVAFIGHGFTPLALATGGLAFTGLAELTHAAIVQRRRPILSDAARYVDLRLRSFASRSLELLQLAGTTLLVGWTVSKAPPIANPVVSTTHVRL
jgi:hypothetical protein